MYYGFVYEWTNVLNGKKYIGSHAGDVNDGYVGSGKAFRHAVEKHGIENFTRGIVEYIVIENRRYLLEREKFYLDAVDAYYNKKYYNIAKDVIGGDTKAGWTDQRRAEFSNQIKQVWANRSKEEKDKIINKTRTKTKEWLETREGKEFRQRQRDSYQSKKEKIIAAIRNRDPEDRKRSARLGKERMGAARRKEAANKGVANRNAETEALARMQAKLTRDNWSDDKRKEVFENSSKGRKGKCTGSSSGRAREIIAAGRTFGSLKDAILQLNISEFKLRKKLLDPNNKEYYYL